MNKTELVDAVSSDAGISKADAGKAVEAVFGNIQAALGKGDSVSVTGFGSFATKERAARKGRNPKTGEQIDIAASKAPTFKAGKTLKDAVN